MLNVMIIALIWQCDPVRFDQATGLVKNANKAVVPAFLAINLYQSGQ